MSMQTNWMTVFLDFFRRTKPGYYLDFAITPPITALVLVATFEASLRFTLWFLVGYALWTLYEYLLHRFVSHGVPLLREAHWLHHDDQKAYIAVPPWVTFTFYVFFLWFFGLTSNALAVGFSVGYTCYSVLHTAFHYARIGRGHPLFWLKRHHVGHHRLHDKNFGVVTTLWDHVFGTYAL